ncbi:MAG: transposase [Nitrospira sp. CG24A]|nr:MAG: transposase [Nitrospira sp. CG24A]
MIRRSRTVHVGQSPQQNGRVERFIGTVKRELAQEPMVDSEHIMRTLKEIRTWYNHERPHDHLRGGRPQKSGRALMYLRRSHQARGESQGQEAQTAGRKDCPAGSVRSQRNEES